MVQLNVRVLERIPCSEAHIYAICENTDRNSLMLISNCKISLFGFERLRRSSDLRSHADALDSRVSSSAITSQIPRTTRTYSQLCDGTAKEILTSPTLHVDLMACVVKCVSSVGVHQRITVPSPDIEPLDGRREVLTSPGPSNLLTEHRTPSLPQTPNRQHATYATNPAVPPGARVLR